MFNGVVMLGIRLPASAEDRLERHAREAGRPKSAIAREWIIQRLERGEIDDLIRHAATLDAVERRRVVGIAANDATDAQLRWLDARPDRRDPR